VIQEAAHEDANIIFGAVVDPQLEGKLKITVIATGFDRKGAGRAMLAAAVQTPVDLSNYTAHLNAAAAANAAEVAAERAAAQGGSSFVPPPMVVNRRPALELSLPLAASGNGAPADGSPDEHSLDIDSPLDVPAFLRRQS
jgi:cell division protein FtsZ